MIWKYVRSSVASSIDQPQPDVVEIAGSSTRLRNGDEALQDFMASLHKRHHDSLEKQP